MSDNSTCANPLSQSDEPLPIQSVLRILASQEGCDGAPWDQMIQAADYIDELFKRAEKYNRLNESLAKNKRLFSDAHSQSVIESQVKRIKKLEDDLSLANCTIDKMRKGAK